MLPMSQPPNSPPQYPPPAQGQGHPGYPAYPIRRRRNYTPAIVIAGLAVLGLMVLLGFIIQLAGGGVMSLPTTRPTTQPPPATTATFAFDRAAFDAHWQQLSQETSWAKLVTKIEPDSYGVTAHTKLFPDGDAVAPALSICRAIASFWAGQDNAPAVRVLDQADNILASTHTGDAASCSYRR